MCRTAGWRCRPEGSRFSFPSDAHAPLGGAGLLKKAIFKIAVISSMATDQHGCLLCGFRLQPEGCHCWLTVNPAPPMLIVPERGAPVVFASTLKLTSPPPDPGEPPVTAIHGALLVAVQLHPPDDDTETVPGPPAAGIVVDGAPSVMVQPESWLIVTVRPATSSVPLRAGPELAAVVTSMLPLPLPAGAETIVIHPAPLDAFQAHDAAPLTSMRADPPAAGAPIVSGETVNVQPESCETVSV